MAEINNIQDLIQALQSNPEWLLAVRGLIITTELAELPARLEELRITFEDRIDRLDGRMDRLDGRMDRLETQTGRVSSRTGNIEGRAYEAHAARVLQYRLYLDLGIRRPQVFYRYQDAHGEPALHNLNHLAAPDDQLSQAELMELADTDIIFRGAAGDMLNETDIYLVVEASITGDRDDAVRADRRRQLLSRMTGTECRGAVVAETLSIALQEALVTHRHNGEPERPTIDAQAFNTRLDDSNDSNDSNEVSPPANTISQDISVLFVPTRGSG